MAVQIPNKNKSHCVNCGIGISTVLGTLSGMCNNCLKEIEAQEKETLKVFRIHVWELDKNTKRTGGLHVTLVLLSTDHVTAYDSVLDRLVEEKYEQDRVELQVVELVGPFTSGYILSQTP